MKINKLSSEVQSSLRSSTIINDTVQCVVELVQNALDAQSSSIAVRLDLEDFMIQVVDNGHGMTKEQLDLIGTRYMTSKCHSLKDLKRNIKYYGFRGESLASLRECCSVLMIMSKTQHCNETYSKVFRGTKQSHVASVSAHNRLCVGTTVIVKGFLVNMPVRRARIQPAIEMEETRHALLALSIIHYKVSFTLRNDTSKVVILQTLEYKDTPEALKHHCNLDRELCLVPVKVTIKPFEILAHISKETEKSNNFQFIYVNKRLIKNRNMYKLVNKALSKSFYLRNTGKEVKAANNKPKELSFPVFVICIKCPYIEYDITSDPRKLLVEFRNWDVITKCLEKICWKFVSSEEKYNFFRKSSTKSTIPPCDEVIAKINQDLEGLPIKSNVLQGISVKRKKHNQNQALHNREKKIKKSASLIKNKVNKSSKSISNESNKTVTGTHCSHGKKAIINKKCTPKLAVVCNDDIKESEKTTSGDTHFNVKDNMEVISKNKLSLLETNITQEQGKKMIKANISEHNHVDMAGNSGLENPFPFKESNDNCRQNTNLPTKPLFNSKHVDHQIFSTPCLEKSLLFKAPNKKCFATKRKWLSEHIMTESESGITPAEKKLYWFSANTEVYNVNKKSILPITCQDNFFNAIRTMSMTRNILLNYPKSSFITPSHELKINIYKSLEKVDNHNSLRVSSKSTYEYLIHNDGYYINCSEDTQSTLMIVKQGFENVLHPLVSNKIDAENVQRFSKQQCGKSPIPTDFKHCKESDKMWHIFSPSLRKGDKQRYKPLAITNIRSLNKRTKPTIHNRMENMIPIGRKTDFKISPSTKTLDVTLTKSAKCLPRPSSIHIFNKSKFKNSHSLIKEPRIPKEGSPFTSYPKVANAFNKTKNNNVYTQMPNNVNKLTAKKSFMFFQENNIEIKSSELPCIKTAKRNKATHHENRQLPGIYKPSKYKFLQKTDSHIKYEQRNTKSKTIQNPGRPVCHEIRRYKKRESIINEFSKNKKYQQHIIQGGSLQDGHVQESYFKNQFIHNGNNNYLDLDCRLGNDKSRSGLKDKTHNVDENYLPMDFHKISSSTNISNYTRALSNNTKALIFPCNKINSIKNVSLNTNSVINRDDLPNDKLKDTIIKRNSFIEEFKKFNEGKMSINNGSKTRSKKPIPEILKFIDSLNLNDANASHSGNNSVVNHYGLINFSCGKKEDLYISSNENNCSMNRNERPNNELKEEIGQRTFVIENNKSNEPRIDKMEVNGSSANKTPFREIDKLIDSDNLNSIDRPLVEHVTLTNNHNCIIFNHEEETNKLLNTEFNKDNLAHYEKLNEGNKRDKTNCFNVVSENCVAPSANEQFWRKETFPNGKPVYINPITGMSTYLTPNDDLKTSYVLSTRHWFMTKGTSPLLLINNVKDSNLQLSDVEKGIVKQIVEPSMKAELDTVKWKNKSEKGMESVFNMLKSSNNDCEWNPRFNFNSSCTFSRDSLKTGKVLGQIDHKFIAALLRPNNQSNKFLVLFDQHAVDERIRLENITKGYQANDGQLVSESVYPSVEINLTENERYIVTELRERMSKCGIMFEPNKEKLMVNGVPLCLINRVSREKNQGMLANMVVVLLRQLILLAEDARGVIPSLPPFLSDIINSEACRGAIKFGDELTLEESQLLICKLAECEVPFQCAHGRPVLTPLIEIKEIEAESGVASSAAHGGSVLCYMETCGLHPSDWIMNLILYVRSTDLHWPVLLAAFRPSLTCQAFYAVEERPINLRKFIKRRQ